MRILLTLLFLSLAAKAQPVYDTGTFAVNSGTGISATIATGANVTSGHLIMACFSNSYPSGVLSVSTLTDTVGTTYSKIGTTITETGADQGYMDTWMGCAAGSGANTLTVGYNHATSFWRIAVASYAGIPCGSSPVDQIATAGTGTGTAAITSATSTTSQASELLFVCAREFNASKTYSVTGGSGYTLRGQTASIRDGVALFDQAVNATGAYTGSGTLNVSTSWSIQMVTLKATAPASSVRVHKVTQ